MKSAPNRRLAAVIDQEDKGNSQAFGFATEMFKPVIHIGTMNVNTTMINIGERPAVYEHSVTRVDGRSVEDEPPKSCWDRICRR